MSSGKLRRALYWAGTLALLLVLISPQLFSKGLFMDGTIYAALSRNMSNGLGAFWTPHLSPLYMNEFYEHPTLAIWIESFFFRFFGDAFWVEKLYGLVISLLAALAISRIWKLLAREHKNFDWLPVLLWFTIPLVFWSVTNNMLESTLIVFVLFAFECLLRYSKSGGLLFIIVAGLLLSCSVLSKGLVGLFLWSYFIWHWLLNTDGSIMRAIFNTVLLVFVTAFPIVFVFYVNEDASHYMEQYWRGQVVRSISEVETVPHRFHILWKLLLQILPMMGLAILSHLILRKKSKHMNIEKKNTLLLSLIGLSAAIPLMITLKQRGFYLLPALPFFALACALVIVPGLDFIQSWADRLPFRIIMALLIGIGITSTWHHFGSYGREADKLSDLALLSEKLDDTRFIGLDAALFEDWHLRAMAQRNHDIHLDPYEPTDRRLILTENSDYLPEGYAPVPLTFSLKRYILLQRKKSA